MTLEILWRSKSQECVRRIEPGRSEFASTSRQAARFGAEMIRASPRFEIPISTADEQGR